MSKSIFNIQGEYMRLMDELEENGGEITEELGEILIQNEEEFKAKAQSYVAVIKTKEGDLAVVDDEIKRLQARKKRIVNTTEKLKSILLDALQLYGIADKKGVIRYSVGTFDLGTRKTNKLAIHGEDELKDSVATYLRDCYNEGTASDNLNELNKGQLSLTYEVPHKEDEPVPELNDVEVDFLNSNLTYDLKLHTSMKNMVKIMDYFQQVMENPAMEVELDVKIPKKETSEIVKTAGGGFRIASINESKNLTIK